MKIISALDILFSELPEPINLKIREKEGSFVTTL